MMYPSRPRIRASLFLTVALAACTEDNTKIPRDRDAAVDMVSAADGDAGDDALAEMDPESGEGADTATSDASEDDSDGGASPSEDDAGTDDPPASAGDAGMSVPVDEEDEDFEISAGPTGRGCHELDALGPLVSATVVATRWPDATGGALVPGTYYLTREEHFVPPEASAAEAADCAAFWGAYRESLLVSDADLARVYQAPDGTFARLVESYRTDGTRLIRNRMCPADSIHPEVSAYSYTATAGELLLFDAVIREGAAAGTKTCEYMFRYERQR